MTGLVRKATLLLSVCGLLAATAAMANVPDPGNSFFDTKLNLVGHDGAGSGDPAGTFKVTVMDLANNPIQGSIVTIDFSGCSDLQFCDDQLGNSTADCATHTVRKASDALGEATFVIIGGSLIDLGDPDGSDCNCVKIFADGTNLAEAGEEVNAGTFDLDCDSGVGGADLTLWLDDFGSGAEPPRSDYDHDPANDCANPSGRVGGADLTIWLDVFGAGLSNGSCPDLGGTKCTP